MELLHGVWSYLVPFVVVLTILVFVHELGHYLVARRCGVRVEVFSIGFGREMFGWTDSANTRWKVSLVPLGGYVKMFGESGDVDESGAPRPLTSDEQRVSFHHKTLGQRAAVVSAGPIANFLFAVVVLAGLFATAGEPYTPSDVGTVTPGSAAEEGGIRPGDRIVRVGGTAIDRFEDIQRIVRDSAGIPLDFVVLRDGAEVSLVVTPRVKEETDNFGNLHRLGFVGIGGGARQYVKRDPVTAVWRAAHETVSLAGSTLGALGQMIIGARTTEELGGPLRIAQMSGEVAQFGLVSLAWFLAVLSINLGLINLFPIPVLDGGYLAFYAVEAIRGKPLGPKALEYGMRIGLALVVGLMVFATWNDLVHLKVFEFLKGLVT
ncbi:MAG: RIP metalloprotease RseP [Alphaproteobacteria bacterium]